MYLTASTHTVCKGRRERPSLDGEKINNTLRCRGRRLDELLDSSLDDSFAAHREANNFFDGELTHSATRCVSATTRCGCREFLITDRAQLHLTLDFGKLLLAAAAVDAAATAAVLPSPLKKCVALKSSRTGFESEAGEPMKRAVAPFTGLSQY